MYKIIYKFYVIVLSFAACAFILKGYPQKSSFVFTNMFKSGCAFFDNFVSSIHNMQL